MGDFSGAPSGQNLSSSALANAIERAKQVAAKINPGDRVGQKRGLEDGTEPDAKKLASLNAPFDNLSNMSVPAPGMGGNILTEELRVPDSMVGLLIGRGGEQISKIQSESGCKVQMAQDSGGLPDRPCTLTGTREAITRARDMIMTIINQRTGGAPQAGRGMGMGPGGPGGPGFPNMHGGPGMPMGGPMGGMGMGDGMRTEQLLIPGGQVGLIIGKGGEMIKQLQEKSGAKLVVVQENSGVEVEKPLRITGEASKVEHAKQLVFELLSERDTVSQVLVPKACVGVVIGKGGDMIKRIQMETNARVQFQQEDADGNGDRICILMGKPPQVQDAKNRIQELIDSILVRDGGRGGRPPFNNAGAPGGFGGNWNSNNQMGGPGRQFGDKQQITFAVPANKCGIVIGKGGETIKGINQTSGAHCELDRNDPPNPNEKIFIIKGTPDQIENAKKLIMDKVGLQPYQMGGGVQQQQSWPQQGYQQQWPQGQDASSGQVPINPQTGQPDYSKQWAEYYRQIGMHREADILEQQAKSLEGMQGGNPAMANAGPAAPAAAAAGSQNGQPDYSVQWAEFYRNTGQIKEAEAIEQQIKMKQMQQAAAVGAAQPGAPQPAAGAPAGQPYTAAAFYPNYYAGIPGQAAPQQQFAYPGYAAYGGQPAPQQPRDGN